MSELIEGIEAGVLDQGHYHGQEKYVYYKLIFLNF